MVSLASRTIGAKRRNGLPRAAPNYTLRLVQIGQASSQDAPLRLLAAVASVLNEDDFEAEGPASLDVVLEHAKEEQTRPWGVKPQTAVLRLESDVEWNTFVRAREVVLLGMGSTSWQALSTWEQVQRLGDLQGELDAAQEPRKSWKRVALAKLSTLVAMELKSMPEEDWRKLSAGNPAIAPSEALSCIENPPATEAALKPPAPGFHDPSSSSGLDEQPVPPQHVDKEPEFAGVILSYLESKADTFESQEDEVDYGGDEETEA
jgi:hypothetical protein